ncbi:MAG: HNH endonuclease [Planctomycetota bacterium]
MAGDFWALVCARAGNRCEYCRTHQSLQGATFHLEHVIPRSKGGLHVSSNLALACPSCNLHKSDRVTIPSPKSSQDVPLFNPRTSLWKQTFDWDDFQIIAKSEIGNATIHALDLNHDRRIRIRQAEKMFGLFPPEAA